MNQERQGGVLGTYEGVHAFYKGVESRLVRCSKVWTFHFQLAAPLQEHRAQPPRMVEATSEQDLYQVRKHLPQTLGSSRDCKDVEIRRAYSNLVTKEHPDKGGDPVTHPPTNTIVDMKPGSTTAATLLQEAEVSCLLCWC